ncbi:Tyrosine-protein kinase, partial [Parasponia andersonii]
MANSFKEKLGEGGFGSVYKGKLQDGFLVVVKLLNESKANGEEFINEVATISRTSHVNIVSLLGFCFEGAKRALIYKFMPNGSPEKFVFDENATENDPRQESLISMLGPRGTVGYIAPEVFSRNFGPVSYKSDVYSYGMMILEIVGGRKNVNVKANNTSEKYFPHWVYNRLELEEEFSLKRVTDDEDRVKVRKMVLVSLWCIQNDPSSRPEMSKVIEMLEGSIDSLQ